MKVLVMILQPVDLQLFPLSRMHQRLHHRQIYLPPQRIQQRQHHRKQQQLNLTSRHWNQLLNLLLSKAIFLLLQVIFWFLDISEVVIRPLDSSLDSKKLNLFIKDNDILRSCVTSADCSNQDPGIQEMCFLILITVTIITVIIMTFIMVSVNHVRVKLIKIASIVIPQRISELMNVFIIVSIYFDRKYFDHVSNLNFSAFWRHWQSLIRNNSSIANALKFKFPAYAFTWQILLRILFALKFKTPRIMNIIADFA